MTDHCGSPRSATAHRESSAGRSWVRLSLSALTLLLPSMASAADGETATAPEPQAAPPAATQGGATQGGDSQGGDSQGGDAEVKKLRAEVRDLRFSLNELQRDAAKDDKLPFGTFRLNKELFLDFHGYFRARYVNGTNFPIGRLDKSGGFAQTAHVGRDDASDASFVYSRLRLDPTLRWGGDPSRGKTPVVSLSAQIDMLDNVMFGDNSRQGSVPLFAENPSAMGINAREQPFLFVRRLWLDIQAPLGLIKVGRQASQGGLGLLFNDGNGFRNDFGDANGGSSFDRVAFATRPLTIYNALTNGNRAPTPLIVLAGHDWLVEDPLGFHGSQGNLASRQAGGPFGLVTDPTCGGKQELDGTKPTEKCDNDVSQWLYALIWKDDKLNLTQKTDELLVGLVYVNRTQDFNKSNMHILDFFWRFQVGLSETGPSIYTEGEVTSITGKTNGLKLLPGGTFSDETGLAENSLEGGVLNYVARLGLKAPTWDAIAEYGYSSGDEQLVGATDDGKSIFKMYPINDDYRMGLLMYPTVLAARSFNTGAGRASGALHSGGGIFNSTYINPKVRYRMNSADSQIELVGQGVLAWADTLNGGYVLGFVSDYFSPRATPPAGGWTDPFDKAPYADNKCGAFDGDCAIGWEIDLAVKIKWLRRNLGFTEARDNYMMQWSNEFGYMSAGKALKDRLAKGADGIWTLQTRIAYLW